MKKIIYLLISVLGICFSGCQESPYFMFRDTDRVQLDDWDEILRVKKEIRYNFIYAKQGPDAVRDTVYLTVLTLGKPRDYDRKVSFRQITEYKQEIIMDEKGNITDTLYHEVLNKGVPGQHYLPMNDPEIAPHLFVPANQVRAEIPVILLRDPSLKEQEMRVCLELTETEDFRLGEDEHLFLTIFMADKYSKPSQWDRLIYHFGDYSERKHEFMTRVAETDINDDWLTYLLADLSLSTMWNKKCRNALNAYNADPDNIANNLAPMKDENGIPVTFPVR